MKDKNNVVEMQVAHVSKWPTVSNSVNRGTSTAGGTRKPVQLVVYKRGSKARERKEKNSSAA